MILNFLKNLITMRDRNLLSDKFDHLDQRMDSLERWQAKQDERLISIRDIGLANNEVLEQKLNTNRATQESIASVINLRFGLISEQIEDLKKLVSRNSH